MIYYDNKRDKDKKFVLLGVKNLDFKDLTHKTQYLNHYDESALHSFASMIAGSDQSKKAKTSSPMARELNHLDYFKDAKSAYLPNHHIRVKKPKNPLRSNPRIKSDQGDQTFFARLQLARADLSRLKTKKRKESRRYKQVDNDIKLPKIFTSEPRSITSLWVMNLLGQGERIKAWERSIIFELAKFSSTYIPMSVYQSQPAIKDKQAHFFYKRGMLRLIEACEARISLRILSTGEKAELLSSNFGYLKSSQKVINRLYFLIKNAKNISK